MKFHDGQAVILNTNRYRVQGERLGRGAVSDVYLALLEDIDDAHVVLKVVRDDATDDIDKAEALQHEAEVLIQLNQVEDETWQHLPNAISRYHQAQETTSKRRIIALLDTGNIAPGQPLVVQEIAPPALERFEITALADEHRVFAIAQAIVDVLALTHRAGMSLKDFEPTTKGDRFRVQWLDEEHQDFTFKMIDWNITGGSEAMAQDLFFFGGHLYYLLTGRHIHLDTEGRPPANLSIGNPGWQTLTAGSQQIVAKLLHRDTRRRYAQVEALADDITWWSDALAQVETSGVFRRLDDRLWQAKPASRYDRVLAIAELALRLDPPADTYQSFEQSRRQAREELDKENWQPIAQAQVMLGTRAYEQADKEFAAQLRILSPESEAARLATIYQRLARVGQLLKAQYAGNDERRTPEWEALETRMIKALVERRWQDAQGALAEVVRLRSESRTWKPLEDLGNWIMGGVRYTREVAAALAEAENSIDPTTPAWLTVEAEKIKLHEKAVVLLEQVQELAPFEQEFKDRLALERDRLKQRQTFIEHYKQADESVKQAEEAFEEARATDEKQTDYDKAAKAYQNALQKLDAALERFEEILHEDPTQRRAQRLAQRLQTHHETATSLQQQALTLHDAQKEMQAGHYDAALKQTSALLQLAPNRVQVREIQAEAEVGARLLKQARDYLLGAESDLNSEKFESALEQVHHFNNLDKRTLRDLTGGQSLPGTVGVHFFYLQPDLKSQASDLKARIEATHNTWDKVEHTEKHDFDEVIYRCKTLESSYPLTAGLRRKYEEARRGVANRMSAAPLITQAQDFEDLRRAHDILRDDEGRVAQDLCQQAAAKWQAFCQPLAQSDLTRLTECLRQGLDLFPQAEAEFAKMLLQANKAQAVAKETTTPPYWFSQAERRSSQLALLAEDLNMLAGPQSWTELRQRAAEWQAVLLNHLDGFIQEELRQIQTQSQAKQFRPALEALDALWDSIPSALRDRLPSVTRDAVNALSAALRGRLVAEQALHALLNRLATSPDFAFQEAARESGANTLPAHPNVPMDDLAAVFAELERAARMELTIALQPVADLEPDAGRQNYAQVIQTCRSLAETRIDVLKQAAPDRTAKLQTGLKETERTAARKLQDALLAAVEEQRRHLTAEPRRMLHLYYQTWWYQSLTVMPPSVEMQTALALPQATLLATAEQINALRDLSGFHESEQLLAKAETLNNEMEYLPLEKLPPLPENVHPTEIGTRWHIPAGSLTALRAQISALKKLFQDIAQIKTQRSHIMSALASDMEKSPAEPPDDTSEYRFDAGQVNKLRDLVNNVRQTIERLRELWQSLELRWNERGELAQLGEEATQHFTIANQLLEAQRLQSSQAMQGLTLLYRELEDKELFKDLGASGQTLLATPRQALHVNYEALQHELIAALGRQIANVLALPDATEQLQRQILMAPQSRWLAEKAYQAIRRGVDEQAAQAEAEGRRDRASRLWEIIQDATAPWATGSQAAIRKQKTSRRKSKPVQTKVAPPVARPAARPTATSPNKASTNRPPTRTAPPKR